MAMCRERKFEGRRAKIVSNLRWPQQLQPPTERIVSGIILTMEQLIDSGAYADIFRASDGLVYKLFTSGSHRTNSTQGLDRPQDDERRRKIFLSECSAYDVATKHAFLSEHVPAFFGRREIRDVIDSRVSVAHCYRLDLCYAMAYVESTPVKLGPHLHAALPRHIASALQEFVNLNICHYVDSSVFFFDDRSRFKFIDFAMEEFPPTE